MPPRTVLDPQTQVVTPEITNVVTPYAGPRRTICRSTRPPPNTRGEPLYLRVAWRCDVVLFLDSACGGRGRSIIGKGSEGSGLSGWPIAGKSCGVRSPGRTPRWTWLRLFV